MALTRAEAAVVYARAWNSLDFSHLERLLADDVHYTSQNVFEELTTKADLVEYLAGKVKTVRRSPDAKVFADLGCVNNRGMQSCVVVAQGVKEDLVALVLFEVEDDKISRIDMCSIAPHPSTAIRLREYPD